MITALVNNEWERIPPESLKLGENTFGFKQGLYETFRTLDYRPVFLAPHLDRQYSAFGKVVKGMDIVDKIKKGDGPNGAVSNPDKIISLKSKK